MVAGCGSSATAPTGQATKPTATATANDTDVSGATVVVAQFLDAVRRGGETGGANQLLTQPAQAVLQRLGRTVEPIGSLDSVYKVTRAEAVPEAPGAALVHSLWTEPNNEKGGELESYEVVWALVKEPVGWRISGLAMDSGDTEEPVFMDFENSQQMATLFNRADASVATAPQGSDPMSQPPVGGAAVQR